MTTQISISVTLSGLDVSTLALVTQFLSSLNSVSGDRTNERFLVTHGHDIAVVEAPAKVEKKARKARIMSDEKKAEFRARMIAGREAKAAKEADVTPAPITVIPPVVVENHKGGLKPDDPAVAEAFAKRETKANGLSAAKAKK